MKNNYSIAQRNAIVEDHLWCIDSIIQKNRPLMRAARLEYDDVYQQLAIRLIKAVAGYDPDKGNLQQHIFAQLKYELLNCKAAFRLCGMTGAPRGFQKSDTKPYVRFTGNQLTMAVPGGKFRTGIQVSGRGSLSLGFDLRYMLDALKQFKDAPEIRVKLSGIFSPIVIEAEGRDDFALVLPVRLKEEMAA